MRITGGDLKKRPIKTLKGLNYRPATAKIREATFSILSSYGLNWHEVTAIDFFAGSGSFGLEALSRGVWEVWFVDNNKKAVDTIRQNLKTFNISKDRYKVFCCDVFSFLNRRLSKKFQLIFIDPPYRKGLLAKFLSKLLTSSIVDEDCFIFAKVEKELIISHDGLTLLANKTYGQTRLYLWRTTASK